MSRRCSSATASGSCRCIRKPSRVHGEQGYPLALPPIPFPVDVVDVFVNSELAGPVADEAVTVGAKAVWFQLGVVDEAAWDRVRDSLVWRW